MPKPEHTLQAVTLGCSKNRVDTEHILAQAGNLYEILPESEQTRHADVFLLNTCGFIGDAKEESIAAIFEAVRRKNVGEIGKIAVFGCLSERYAAELPGLVPEVDAWFGARDFTPLLEWLGVSGHGVRTRNMRKGQIPDHAGTLCLSENFGRL